jgi:hypothetical protein
VSAPGRARIAGTPALTLTLGLALAVAFAGCGGSHTKTATPASFAADFQPLHMQIAATAAAVAQTLQTAPNLSDQQLANAFGAQARDVANEHVHLQALSPPTPDVTVFGSLLTALGKIGDDLNQLSNAAAAGDTGSAKLVTAAVIRDGGAVKAANDGLGRVFGIPDA